MTDINEYFDKIYIINLESRQDRWKRITEQLEELNITNFIRFNAIQPILEEIDKKLYSHMGTNVGGKKRNQALIGKVGCRLSHLHVVKDAQENSFQRILILEDDAFFTKKFINNFNQVITEIDNKKIEYDMLYLGGNYIKVGKKISNWIYKSIRTNTTHAYALQNTNNIYQHIIDLLEEYEREIDILYRDIKFTKNYQIYIVKPSIITQYSSHSDIELRTTNYKSIK